MGRGATASTAHPSQPHLPPAAPVSDEPAGQRPYCLWRPPGPPESPDGDALREAYAPDRRSPGLRLNFATSLDGAVEIDGRSRELSSDADREVFGILRLHADAIMVGGGTLRKERYRPVRLDEAAHAWRRERGLAEDPTLVIVSSSLGLDAGHAVFTDAPVRPMVLTHATAPPANWASLEPVADVVSCGDDLVDLAKGFAELRRRGLAQVLCEGGPHLFGSLLAADLVDEMCLTLSPLLTGPGAGRIVAGAGRAIPQGMRLVHVLLAGDQLLTRYARATS